MYGKTLQEAKCWRGVLQSSKGNVHRGVRGKSAEDTEDRQVTVLGPGCGCRLCILQQQPLASARVPPRKQISHMAEL